MLDCTPKGSILRALASQNLSWLDALCEWIDNALDWKATNVEIIFGRDGGGKELVAVKDNGAGCADFTCFLRLGEHHESHGLGRFGVGSKDAALWIGGETSKLNIRSVKAGTRRELVVGWADIAERGWQVDEPSVCAAEPGEIGTRLEVRPVQRRIPEGQAWDELVREIGYRYFAAIRDGRQITILSKKKGSLPVPLPKWEMPPLRPGHIDTHIEIGGRKAHVCVGIVRDGHLNEKRGITYVHKFRVIKSASSKGCGVHSPARISGFVEVDESWPLTKNKDDIQNAEALYEAVEQACETLFQNADRISAEMASKHFVDAVEAMLNPGGDPDSKAKRGPGDGSGTKEPTGKGGKHTRAKNEQNGSTFGGKKSRSRRIKIDYTELGNTDDPGEFQPPTVILNLTNPHVAAARDSGNVMATAVIAAAVVAIRECRASKSERQTSFRLVEEHEIDRRFRQVMGGLLSGPVAIDGRSTVPQAAE